MVQSGELPAGPTCAHSGEPTDDVLLLEILLPRHFQKKDSRENGLLMTGGLIEVLPHLLLRAMFSHEEIEEEGALTVRAPLRVAARHHLRVRKMGQWRLRRLLRTVPVYAKLLEENGYAGRGRGIGALVERAFPTPFPRRKIQEESLKSGTADPTE
jgi:hypothetical protein